MTWLNRLIRHNEVEGGLDKELRFHFDGMVQDLCAQGVPRDEAIRQARLQFGGLEQVKEECRDARGTCWVEDLGATRGHVLWLVLRETLGMALVGAFVGLGLTIACIRLAVKLLYGLSPDDPFTLAAAFLALMATAMLAGYLPARRASRVDPVVALRCE